MRPPSILLPPPLMCFLLFCSAQNTSCIIHFPFHAPVLLCWTSTLSSLPRVLTYWAVQRRWFARVNALCNLSGKKTREIAASLPGRFLSRRCFILCITMEVEPRIAKQYKCHQRCSCKNYRRKGM